MEVSGELYALTSLPVKYHPVTLNRRLVGSHIRSGPFGKEKHLLALPGIGPKFLVCSACSLVVIQIKLSRSKHRIIFANSNLHQQLTEVAPKYDRVIIFTH